MSAIPEYQAALRSYRTNLASADEMFKFIAKVADLISYKQVAFLTHIFNVPSPVDQIHDVRNEAKNHRYDLAKWPSREDMTAIIKSWQASFEALNAAWNKIPHEDKTGIEPPPKVMRTTS